MGQEPCLQACVSDARPEVSLPEHFQGCFAVCDNAQPVELHFLEQRCQLHDDAVAVNLRRNAVLHSLIIHAAGASSRPLLSMHSNDG